MTRTIDKVLYTGSTLTTGGRDGTGKSSDGALDVRLSLPGSGGPGTNPEQLLAVGWSACFMGAMRRRCRPGVRPARARLDGPLGPSALRGGAVDAPARDARPRCRSRPSSRA